MVEGCCLVVPGRSCRLAVCLCLTVLWSTGGETAGEPVPIGQYCHRNWCDELPQRTVHSIVQTSDGYLWFGTYEGLARFDGVQLTVYDSVRTGDLPGRAVIHLHEDRLGKLWISTNGGLTVLDRGVFTTYTSADGLPSDVVNVSCSDSDGTLWIGSNRGLARFRDGSMTVVDDPSGPADLTIRSLATSSDGSRVKVRAEPISSDSSPLGVASVRIDVIDQGIGIEEEQVELIFEEFRQVDSSPTRRYEGSGLGLALVRRLLALQGGQIRVDSEPDHGSTFSVYLPLV